MKKKIIAFAALVLCMTVFASGTLAYFTKDDVATNVFTTGGIDIKLQEWADMDKTISFGDRYPDNKVQVMPGKKLTKVVTVKNEQEPAYIRAKYVITVTDKDGAKMDVPADVIKIIVNETEWEKHGDWYYYVKDKGVVSTGISTESLFDTVEFDGPKMDNKYQNCTVKIDVYAEAVQTANNIPSSGNPYDADGWAI